ncbi:hypothetical protein [Streptomyces sp. NPDC085932]|uniref:hypothetical protein n=1 Tax=Streptomyces sp. NPDC085932 TaxID=3365741 RepID=UPI0037D5B3E7
MKTVDRLGLVAVPFSKDEQMTRRCRCPQALSDVTRADSTLVAPAQHTDRRRPRYRTTAAKDIGARATDLAEASPAIVAA